MEPSACGNGQIVFARGVMQTVSVNIWTAAQDGTGLRRLTDGKNDEFPRCLPDGKTVLYADIPGFTYMKVPFAGGKPQRFSSERAESFAGFDISPDGKTAALGTYDFKAQRPNISLTSIESGQVLRVLEYDPRHSGKLHFAPDGKGLVYPIREKGVDNLWLQPLDGGPGHLITNFTSLKIYSYDWSPDGKSLALVRGDSPSDLVLIQDASKK
jgi:Tol biopolymer transport system component